MKPPTAPVPEQVSGRLSKVERRRQLLDVARAVIREEGADRLTLGHLAARAGVSKPIAYDHFGTRSGLLIELYRELDAEAANAMREAVKNGQTSLADTADILAAAYVHCSADANGEWQIVGAALSGSNERTAVHEELLDGYVQIFVSAVRPYVALAPEELRRRCVGLIGAGEAISVMMIAGHSTENEAAATFAALIRGGLGAPA